MKPHIFLPGKDANLPGPYCKFCHYSEPHSNKRGCPKRGPGQITDKMRLEKLLELIRPRWILGRNDIDAVIRAERSLRKK